MSDCEGSAAEAEGFLLAFLRFAPHCPIFEGGFGNDGDAVVLAVTELACCQVTACAGAATRGDFCCCCGDEAHLAFRFAEFGSHTLALEYRA